MQPDAAKKSNTLLYVVVGVAVAIPALVCLVGIVSAVAIPTFVGYTRRSKTAEARSNLLVLASAVEADCGSERARPDGTVGPAGLVQSAGPVPAEPGPNKQIGAFASDPGFARIGFAPPDPVYFSYAIAPDPSIEGGVVLRASGDLDGDAMRSTFELRCRPECTCDRTPTVASEME